MKDRRTTRLRSDLKHGDFVTKRKGWFIPLEPKPNALVWGIYDRNEGLVTNMVSNKYNELFFYSDSGKLTSWETNDKYIDFAPKGNFISKFVKRLKGLDSLKSYLMNKCIDSTANQTKTKRQ